MENYIAASALCGLLALMFAVPFVGWTSWRLSRWAADKITRHVLGK